MTDTNEPSGASGGSLAWIPVTEQVPEDGIRVLACYDGKVFTAERFEGIWHWIEGNTFTPHVEHWMPLPAPPTDAK